MIQHDFDYIANAGFIPWHHLKNKTIFLTGGTGTIGSAVVRGLFYASEIYQLNLKILVLVRDYEKAKQQFQEMCREKSIVTLVKGKVEDLPEIEVNIDYIIHAACPTESQYFVDHPVELIKTSVNGTLNVLELARQKKIQGLVYLSSMEIYGEVKEEVLLTEERLGNIDLKNVRNSYPESKRMCELLCHAYAKEYGVPSKSIRLAQTFGDGMPNDAKKVYAMMAKCAIERNNIVLQTKGESKHPYLYVMEAVTAILTVLLKGMLGESYNAANPETYCSIYEMGELVAKEVADGNIQVKIEAYGDTTKYPKPSYLKLDTRKIEKLGWKAEVTLLEMYQSMITNSL